MVKLRAYSRIVMFLLFTIAIYSAWVIGKVLVARTTYAAILWRNVIFRLWAKAMAFVLHMRVTVQGQPPQPPFILVSNHVSYVDIIALATQLDCVFVAKHDVTSWPLLGYMGKNIGAIFIDRKRLRDIPRVIGLIEESLNEGRGVVFFPEGTSSKGASVMRFLPSLMEPAAKMNFPVSYASVSYRTPPDAKPAHLSVCWWGGMSFRKHLYDLFHVESFDAIVTFGDHPIQETDRKLLAQKLHDAIESQFEPVVIEADTE